MSRSLPFALALFLAAQPGFSTRIDSVLLPKEPVKEEGPRALRLAEGASLQPLAVLRPASEGAVDQLDAIAAWNRSQGRPAKNGFARPLPIPRPVRFTRDLLERQPAKFAGGALLAPPSGGLVWGAELRVEQAHRIRIHLADVRLPKGTRLWVYSEDGREEVPFAADAVTYGGEIWTPSVEGPAARIEVRLPEGKADAIDGQGFTLDQVLELVDLDADGAPRLSTDFPEKASDVTCLVNAACSSSADLGVMEVYKRAVARLQFVDNGQGFLCSGGLLNDTDNTTTNPYLLTAHHCVGSQAVASTLEAFFDFIAPGCSGGTAPPLATLPRTSGATLLATGEGSDFTLVQLSSLPPGRGLLGSTNEPVANGAAMHRLSHPLGQPQRYSATTLATSGPTCIGVSRPNFLYSVRTSGGVFGGSSGSPVVGADGRVVGQLLGACGPTAGEGCDSRNFVVDGAFAASWPAVSRWLAPAPGSCVPGPNTLCLGENERFRVEATFETGSQQGRAQVVKLTDDTGYLWFFNPTNVEAVVKVLDACSFNQRFWIFAGGLTNVRTTIRITDTATQTVKIYTNPQGTAFQPVQDVDAFATCR
jgi:lysyl endopeptidase